MKYAINKYNNANFQIVCDTKYNYHCTNGDLVEIKNHEPSSNHVDVHL
jgi:hypothetical protein